MRQRLVQGIGGTLRFTPPESGTPTSPTVTLRRASGADLPTPVTDAVATVTNGVLSYVLSGAQCPDPYTTGEHLYRASWRYTIGSVVYESDQLYEVRRRLLKPTLTYAELERDLPAPVNDLVEGGVTTVQDAMGDAWDDVLDDLAAEGYEPDKILDADRLRRPHRERTIVRLARAWGPPWRQFAVDREDAYRRALTAALGAGDWYDAAADLKKSADEVRTPSIVLTR